MVKETTIQSLYGTFDEEQLEKIRVSIKEICELMSKIAGHRTEINDIISFVDEEVGLPKKVVRRMAKTHFKNNFGEEVLENKEFEALFQVVAGKNYDD